jgi:hypothetical protein
MSEHEPADRRKHSGGNLDRGSKELEQLRRRLATVARRSATTDFDAAS